MEDGSQMMPLLLCGIRENFLESLTQTTHKGKRILDILDKRHNLNLNKAMRTENSLVAEGNTLFP